MSSNMAERTNAEKLAAGRRKLKEFQQKYKEKSPVQNKKSRELLGKEEGFENAQLSTVNLEPIKPSTNMNFEGKMNSLGIDSPLEINGCKDTLITIEGKSQQLVKNDSQTAINHKNYENGSLDGPYGSPDDLLPSSSPEKSSTEALRQLSLQMDGLVADSLLLEADSGASQLQGSQSVGMDVELQKRNQELAGLLEEERRQADALRVQIKECKSRIIQLESEKETWVSESNMRLEREMRPLREQLQLHVQTVGVLVGEKTELSAALSRSQVVARQKTELVQELQTKLRDSQDRLTELARELSAAHEDHALLKQKILKYEGDAAKCTSELNQIRLQLEERNQEVSEARQKLSLRSNEVISLQKELEDSKSKLSLFRLRLRQLTGSVEGTEDEDVEQVGKDEAAETWHHHRMRLEHQNENLKRTAREAVEEREEASRRFQTYIHTLNGQMEGLAKKVEILTSENKALAEREQSLVSHLSELEKQLQKSTNKPMCKDEEDAASDHRKSIEKKCIYLQEQLDDKNEELDSLQDKLKTLGCKLEETVAELEIERRNQIEKERIENNESRIEREHLLLAAMESDKVAASRAVDQNLRLKAQLTELQDAFVKLSNDKLLLTEKLNNEQYFNKDQAEKLSKLEQQLHQLKIRQEAESDHSHVDENQKEIIADLKLKVNLLEEERDRLMKEPKERVGGEEVMLLNPVHSKEQGLLQENGEPEDMSYKSDQLLTDSEAAQKLEERFRCTMEELATLTEEKQRLEHLVMQLQGETETIGEYVALYQTQRGLLRQRAREKDEQLKKLSRDREELRCKLSKLESLVHKLVNEEEFNSDQSIGAPFGEEPKESCEPSSLQEVCSSDSDSIKGKTTRQIMALLTEIGSNSSLAEASLPSSFHPCPWCSGQLLTV